MIPHIRSESPQIMIPNTFHHVFMITEDGTAYFQNLAVFRKYRNLNISKTS